MERKDTVKRDNLLAKFIKEHKGNENAVTASDICNYLQSFGFYVKPRGINAIITNLKFKRTLPICYTRGKGYFWAKTKDEIKSTIRDIELMIQSLKEHRDLLKSFIIE